MEKINKKLEELTNDYDDILFYDRDELHRLGAYDKGKEDKTKEVAKAMLEEGLEIKLISKITKLSIKEIKEIEKELKSDNN